MSNDILSLINTRRTPQGEQADPREVKNSAGGFVFEVGLEQRIRRFLTIGSEGTYYVKGPELTKDNAKLLIEVARTDPALLLRCILDVSLRGAAPKQNPTIFALAILASLADADGRRAALDALPDVARTGTHLFLFARYVEQFRGWGRGLRRGVANWYTSKSADNLAYQMVKYRQREGWTHRDLMRLSHPVANDSSLRSLYAWASKGTVDEMTPRLIWDFNSVNHPECSEDHAATLIRQNRSLTWEMLPDRMINSRKIWDALLDSNVPQTALMRQLPRLTRIGVISPVGGRTAQVAAQLTDPVRLAKGRVHPMNVLVAHRTYASGRSEKGASTWTPVRQITDALDDAFYAAFGAVEPTGKRTLLALDVSGSMTAPIGTIPLDCREASAALALVTMATERDVVAIAFSDSASSSAYGWGYRNAVNYEPVVLGISPKQRLSDAVRDVSSLGFAGTDCSLPARWAQSHGYDFDTIVIYTDSETWHGPEHPYQALTRYRQSVGHDVKQVVVGMTSTGFTIADPSDASSLDVAGMDVAVPNLISEFSRGGI